MAAGVGGYSHVHLIPHLEGLDQRREIGRGSFGAVYEVKMNGLPCIAKGLHDILLGRGGNLPISETDKEAIRAKFHDECALLGNLKHPNIVQFLGVHRSKDDDEWLMMEYLHMDLAKCLEMNPDIPLPLKLSILRDVSYGLLHLHSQAPPIIHRDLTAPNILLTQGMSAKIADLGVSKIFDTCQVQRRALTVAPGTLAYMPSEALSPDPKYDAKLDVFSYGTLTLYVANQEFPTVYEPPIPSLVTKKQEIQIYKRKPWVDKMGVVHPLHSVVMSCLMDHPDHRPTSKELNDIITKLCTQHENSCKNVLEAQLLDEELRRTKGEKAKLELATRDYRQRLKELQREHEEGLREKMEAHMAELDELKSRYMQKYEALVAKPALVEEEEEQLERGEGSVPSREALQQRVAELSGQLQDKEASMATVTEHHKEELAQLMSHVENQSRAIVELKSSKASLEDVIKQLTEQLEAVGQERSQLEQKAILLGGELKNAKSTAKGSQTLQREVERLREENTSQVNALRAVMKEKEELAGQMELMRAQAQAYKEDFQQERKDREDAHTRSANMEAEHVSREEGLVAELERVKASSLATTQELQTRTLQVEELRKQVDTCKAELEVLQSVCVSQEDPGLKQQIEELRIENERLKRSPPHAVSLYTHGKPLQSSGSSVMAREYRNSDHQGPVPSPDYTASREPLSDAPRTSTQQSFSMGVTAPSQRDPPPHVRPSSPHPHGNELFKSHSRQRSNSLGSVKQLGFDLPLQQTSTPHHHPGIIAPLLPLRAVSTHLRTPNQERPAQALLASVPTGHQSGADVSARVDNDIHHQADVNEPAPMDPNLTCPNCREQFRKGEIQSYKRHVSGCLLRTGSM